jgi:hypothetical protein
MDGAAPALPLESSRHVSLPMRWFYTVLVLVMTGIVVIGFWPFWAGLFTGGTGAHWIIYVHAAVFSGWMVLLFVQVILVARRRVAVHQRLGRAGIYYGFVVLLLGLIITFASPAMNVAAGRASLDEAAGFLILPLGDMLLFGAFFGAGVAYRRKKELHKRLMVLATIALLFAPAARAGGDSGMLAVLAIWLLPLALAVTYDLYSRRRVERVYVVGLLVFLVAFGRVVLMESELWLPIGRWLLLPFIPDAGPA